MPGHLVKFNPGFRSDDEILAEFLVRQADLDLILGVIRQNTAAPANQHILVIGPRGIGKTTLVLRVAAEIRKRDAELGANWCPLVFSEESYPVSTPGEFWLEAIYHLAAQTGDKAWTKAHEELREEGDETRLRERALARLLDFGQGQGKRLLLIVENLQMLLGDQISADDAWVLRHTLQNEPRLMLLGTATTRFWELNSINHAFYETFRVHDLKPLSNEACRGLWEAVSGVPISETRVRPIQILTGGNPRLLAIIASFGARSSLRELMGDLTRLVDDHTDYFKSHLDDLPAMERKVFVGLCDLWDPATAAQVARAARTDTNKASAQLQRLVKRGAVIAERDRRKRTYWVAERLYNIYYLMRRRATPSARVRALVRFMSAFYEGPELIAVVEIIARDLASLPPARMVEQIVFLQELAETVGVGRLAEQMRRAVVPAITAALGRAVSPAKLIMLGATPGHERADLEEALRALVNANSDLPGPWFLLGVLLSVWTGRRSEAEECFRKVIDIDASSLVGWWGVLWVLLFQPERWEELSSVVSRLLNAQPALLPLWALAVMVFAIRPETRDQVISTAQACVDQAGRSCESLSKMSSALLGTNRSEYLSVAERYAREALTQDPSNSVYAYGLACVLAKSGIWEEAFDLLRTALADVDTVQLHIKDLTDLLIDAAAAGHGHRVAQMIDATGADKALEPLAFAVRLDLRESVSVAPEILEVAKDILAKIRERREALGKKPADECPGQAW